MKNKPFEMCMLFDFYGEILTEKQKEAFDLYYNEDLSLSEISEHLGITRQGVRDAVLKAENILRDTEQKLGLMTRYGKITDEMQKISYITKRMTILNHDKYRNAELQNYILNIENIAKKLTF